MITKYYNLPYLERSIYREFMLRDDIYNYGYLYTLISKDKSNIIVAICSTTLKMFDTFEELLYGIEIETEDFIKAHRRLGTEYDSFYPSISIVDI